MEDVQNFAEKKYVPADRIEQNANLLHQILIRAWLTLLTAGVFILGVYKSIVAWLLDSREPKIISGYVALVTGGANGLGRAIAIGLAKRGCSVAIVDVDMTGAKKTCQELRDFGATAMAYQIDVSSYEQVKNLKEHIENDIGPVDILINNAGIVSGTSLLRRKPEDIDRIIDVNLKSQFWTIMTFLNGMMERHRGHIVSICSVFAWDGFAGSEGYSASKYGVRGLMDSLAEELRWMKTPVKVTTVYPNLINSRKELADNLLSSSVMNNDMTRQFVNTPEEVAEITINAMLRNQRHAFMNPIAAFAMTNLASFPDALHDTLNDYLKPRFTGLP